MRISVPYAQATNVDFLPLNRRRNCSRVCAKGQAICIPSNYSKFDLPNETLTVVHVGIDIKDIPKIDDQEYRDVWLH